jgi:hypothetical protein
VLSDLSSSGFVYRTGAGDTARYRVTSDVDRRAVMLAQDAEAITMLVWVAVYRGATSEEALMERLVLEEAQVKDALARLEERGGLWRDAQGRWAASGVVVPVGAEHGWEAAVFDHYQAMVTAITRKLRGRAGRSSQADMDGGSTLSFEVHDAHPLRGEVHALLKTTRERVNELWQRVGAYNRENPCSDAEREIVSFYFGQSVCPPEDE